jgi:hypothetical protein
MSTPAPKATYNLVDNTLSVPDLVSGIAFVQGITKRGPVKDPSILVYSWAQFVQLFGGYLSTSDFPLHCKILLDRGVVLRVNSIKTNADTASVNVVNSEVSPDLLFTLASKYEGVDYNNLSAIVSAPSDENLGTFNLLVSFNEGEYTETYENLKADEDILNAAFANSKWVEIEAMGAIDTLLAGASEGDETVVTPAFATYELVGGDDGDLDIDVDLADFTPWDEYDDGVFLSVLCDTTAVPGAIETAGEAYATSRKDLRYYASIETSDDSNTIITTRKTLPYSRYISYSSGGWEIIHPNTGVLYNISEISHFIANGVNTISQDGWWFSFSGPDKPVSNVLKPVNNYGSKAKFTELDQLNRNQVNMAINRNGLNMFWGNFSGQRENTHTKFISTNNLIIFMGKSLIPIMESFIEKPLDIPLFRTIYYTVKPFLNRLVTGRAIFDYQWVGDQNVNTIQEVTVNTPEDIQMGKYKVRLPITRINPLQEFELTIELTRAGATIE